MLVQIVKKMLGKTMVSVLFLITTVHSLPTGAPLAACEAMRPEHGSNKPQPLEKSPYYVRAIVDPNQANRVIGMQVPSHLCTKPAAELYF